jgi:adenylate cyclase
MQALSKHWRRIAVTLIPLIIALLHASGAVRLEVLSRLDDIIYDARLRATMPKTLDDRVVIVDIDEKSLAEVGRWPWGRNKLAHLIDELYDKQHVAIVGFDVVFAEPDESSGLKRLRQLAQNELRDSALGDKLQQLQGQLDYDALFAKSLQARPVVMGYYFTSDRQGRTSGVLPSPVMKREDLKGRPVAFTSWDGYGANIEALSTAAPLAGFFNSLTDSDGVVRALPLIAEYKGQYYESLALSMFRLLVGLPKVEAGIPQDRFISRNYKGLESIILRNKNNQTLALPVDNRVAALIPFRGDGGPQGNSFRYYSAADLLTGKIPANTLKDKVVLVGTTAPGLLDLRVTPVSEVYPGVEAHANLISGMLDGKVFIKPDYAIGFEVVILLLAGLTLALALPLVTAMRAVLLSLAVMFCIVALNSWMYLGFGLVLPVASAIIMILASFALNMSYGYFVESRTKRELAHLFGTYVPPELVDEMVKDPDSYSMKAASKELTVMFCDMRGFTKMSETMDPTQLQNLLNGVFSRLTGIIRKNRGTIDKYMGDCVMAFWGAPVELGNHAELATQAALEMAAEVRLINQEHRQTGLPEIGIGIGLNTGPMAVGDMGSDIRRSYTVIGDSVNLGSRLEGLSKVYGVDIVVSEFTRKLANSYTWQELDKVRVKGKDVAVGIFWPLGPSSQMSDEQNAELKAWNMAIKAYRAQDWDQCDVNLLNAQRFNAKKYLYELYAQRVASMRLLPFDPGWDGATNFETK